MVEEIVKQMTLKEKVGQLNQHLYGWQCFEKVADHYELTETFKKHVKEFGGVGAIYGIMRADAWSQIDKNNGISREDSKKVITMIQDYIKKHSRFNIPALISEECVHGHMALKSAVFPTQLAMGMTWNIELMEQVSQNVSQELAAKGGNLALFTGFDVLRDPRWGRSEECFSEDPYLTSQMVKAGVTGFQKDNHSVGIVVKHLCGQGAGVGGHNSDAANIGMRELREIHLPPVKAAVMANASAVMAAYNEIDGIPCHINQYLLNDILRKEYGFNGIVMADGCALDRLLLMNDNPLLMGSKALKAGVDLSLWDQVYLKLDDAIKSGYLQEKELDQAVIRVLKLKEKLGLFKPSKNIPLPESDDLLLECARECQVLLKNENRILPIATDKKIAVIGPNAHNYLNQLGDYTAYQEADDIVTVLQGIAKKTKTPPMFALGCTTRLKQFEDLDQTLKIAKEADVVVMVLGGNSTRLYQNDFENNGALKIQEYNEMNCGENIDLASLELEGYQNQLLQEVSKVNSNIVTVLIQGRPHVIDQVLKYSKAVIASFYPGARGGDGISDVLFGDYNPSGHLSVSLPRHVGALPCYYNHKYNGAQKDYVDLKPGPLLPFGYGLSYSDFVYQNISIPKTISISKLKKDGLEISLDICNLSNIDGSDVIQVYLKHLNASIVVRILELKGFKKVFVPKLAKVNVQIKLTYEDFAIWDEFMNFTVEAGKVMICLGQDSQNYQEYLLTIEK
ncbi:glycoside hydrolase family 3 N-terminal domain-containing protein [uncultured Thomasclavelia sp.]|uniref:glycoside hydrolase family 3 N-terminal domain-containing protein n=1 Tax=uncultured Thomasclavelia sp. TaxID=3025759 RepID=UPI0025DBFB0E|nr:glycoside hydrolase family 3 N-terminal domain-containing protein [uncultured Thomasclavelia sp.]